jgi:phosphatidylglycerophosphate synthase
MTHKTHFKNAERHQLSILTPIERVTLRWLAEHMPAWVHSDHLTILGFAGMILTGVCYYLAQFNPLFLVASIVCLAINWFGDSLDGTLARLRNRQRPRYGFYVDHIVDAFGIAFVLTGLAFSTYMSPSIAMAFLIAYFLMNIEIYLATYTVGVFKLSYGLMGPTELRVIVALGNLVLLTRKSVRIGDSYHLLCDVSGVVAIVVILAITIVSTIKNTKRLYNEERLP